MGMRGRHFQLLGALLLSALQYLLSIQVQASDGFFRAFPSNTSNVLANVSLIATTDSLYHGLTESTENPNLAINGELLVGEYWYAGVLTGVARADQIKERHQPLNAYAGFEALLPINSPTHWYAGTTVTHRKFLNSNKEWDYWEYSGQIRNSAGFSASIDYAPDYYAHRTTAVVSQLSYFYDFSDRYFTHTNIGYAAFSNTSDYIFGHVSIGRIFHQSSIELGYFWHNHPNEYRFRDPIQDNMLRFSFSHRLH